MTTIGSLFTGAGGLDMAVESHYNGFTRWRSDIKPASVKLIDYYYPGTNLGDLTAIDWDTVPTPDILCGGFPCTDVSPAGKRAGLIRYGDNTRTGLWGHMADAVNQLKPRLVIAENVRGLLSGKADRPTPVGPGAVPVEDGQLRALGAVLGDLADIGYDAAWVGIRASDVGAPHQRFRIFLQAWPQNLPHASHIGYQRTRPARDGWDGSADSSDVAADTDHNELARQRVQQLRPAAATRGGAGDDFAAHTERVGRGEGRSESARLEGRPVDAIGGGQVSWGEYGPAVERWETILGRPAPHPTAPTARGTDRLSADFVDWMMGWPAGWTDIPGLTRAQRLSLGGDGVVPQQAIAALSYLDGIRLAGAQ